MKEIEIPSETEPTRLVEILLKENETPVSVSYRGQKFVFRTWPEMCEFIFGMLVVLEFYDTRS